MKMKTHHIIVAMAALALVAGCAKPETPAPAAPSSTTTEAPKPAETASAAKAPPLGTRLPADHYEIILNATPSDLKVGKAKFTAMIGHHGAAAEGVAVKLTTHMPNMGHDGPGTTLKASRPGVYEGELDLPMAGEYTAKVTLELPGHPGVAEYSFTVSK